MTQTVAPQKVKSAQQRAEALELRAIGHSFQEIGQRLGVSTQRAWKIVTSALDELNAKTLEKAEQVRRLQLIRLNRLRASLDNFKADPRTAAVLLSIIERESKLLGLDAPQRIEQSGPEGGPIQTEEVAPNYDLLPLEKRKQLRSLLDEVEGATDKDVKP